MPRPIGPDELAGTACELSDRLIRNVYKVLLTRSLSGTIIYSTDEETRDKLRTLVKSG